jgi:serine/threonine protein kinase
VFVRDMVRISARTSAGTIGRPVRRRLFHGGDGEVYAGFDETLKRRVALKAIRAEQRLDPEAMARFLREARILSQLDHANICRLFDYIEDSD